MIAAIAFATAIAIPTTHHVVLHDRDRLSVAADDAGSTMMQRTAGAPRTIDKGDQSNIDDARQVVVRNEVDWARLWQQHAPDRPRPQIDFTSETIVALFMGSRPNAGFSTAIVSATEGGGALIVRYTETRPGRDTVSAQVLTSPYHIVAIARATATNVRFEKAEQ
jgi:protease stability complex PrcB-like protein